jgi:putative endonuclease
LVERVPNAFGRKCVYGNVSFRKASERIPSSLQINFMFYCYILQSQKDFSFYVGQCEDLDCRMSKHFDGLSKYTASKRPLRLVCFESFATRQEALAREKQIKAKKNKKYIEYLISNWCPIG